MKKVNYVFESDILWIYPQNILDILRVIFDCLGDQITPTSSAG